jgi:hypothetical protein
VPPAATVIGWHLLRVHCTHTFVAPTAVAAGEASKHRRRRAEERCQRLSQNVSHKRSLPSSSTGSITMFEPCAIPPLWHCDGTSFHIIRKKPGECASPSVHGQSAPKGRTGKTFSHTPRRGNSNRNGNSVRATPQTFMARDDRPQGPVAHCRSKKAATTRRRHRHQNSAKTAHQDPRKLNRSTTPERHTKAHRNERLQWRSAKIPGVLNTTPTEIVFDNYPPSCSCERSESRRWEADPRGATGAGQTKFAIDVVPAQTAEVPRARHKNSKWTIVQS